MTLRLKRLDGVAMPTSGEDTTTPATVVSPGLTPQEQPPPPTPSAPPSGYMQGLIAKILNNVHVTFENVIVKYIEEDIVLSLNIKKATYATVDDNWEGAFVGKEITCAIVKVWLTWAQVGDKEEVKL